MSRKINLIGQKFGRLTVIEEDTEKSKEKNRVHWFCECDCGNPNYVSVSADRLKSGNTKSCGCYRKEIHSNPNKFEKLEDGTIKFYSNNSDGYFIIDEIDFEKVRKHSWREDKDGYFVSAYGENKKIIYIRLHRYILENELTGNKKEVVDHIKTLDKWDNRRQNLRITDTFGNSKNRKTHKNNDSGIPGVCFSKNSNKWQVYAQMKHYGYYSDKYEAFLRSKEIRTNLYGEFDSTDWNKIEKELFLNSQNHKNKEK